MKMAYLYFSAESCEMKSNEWYPIDVFLRENETLGVMIVECTQFKTALSCSRVKRKRKLKVRGNVVLFVTFDSVDVVNV
ncbi:hypothetical protein TNCV_3323431 [Trichonephila clavipes]|nr:hypothetical protein TNCV_3323431 [Trichonephila clavipes]